MSFITRLLPTLPIPSYTARFNKSTISTWKKTAAPMMTSYTASTSFIPYFIFSTSFSMRSLSLSRSFPTTSTTSTCKDRVYPPRPQVHNTSRLAKLKPEAHRILIPPAESEMEWFPRCGAQPLKGQKELRAKILKLWIWGLWNGERLVAESNLHDMCIYI